MALVATGKTSVEIGKLLLISADTVKTHILNVRTLARKTLGIDPDAPMSRIDLVGWYTKVYQPAMAPLRVEQAAGPMIQKLQDGTADPTWAALYACLLACAEDGRVDQVPEALEQMLWTCYGSGVVTGISAHFRRWQILWYEDGHLLLEQASNLVQAYEAVWRRVDRVERPQMLHDLKTLRRVYPAMGEWFDSLALRLRGI